jgi:hypothetical protein
MRRFEILTDWNGWRRIEMLVGSCLILFGALVALFPKLLVFIFAALCIGTGLALVYAAFKSRLSARTFNEGPGFDVYSSW